MCGHMDGVADEDGHQVFADGEWAVESSGTGASDDVGLGGVQCSYGE